MTLRRTILVAMICLGSGSAWAAPPKPEAHTELDPKVHTIRWRPEWGKVRWPELALTGVATGVAVAGQIIEPFGKPWTSSLLGDDDARPALRLGSPNDRRVARDFSDVLLTSMVGFPIIIDALVVAGWSRQSTDVAGQMLLIDSEVFAITMAIQGIANVVANRQRPYVGDCGGELDPNSLDCEGFGRHRSFFSGHTAASFAAASLVCSHGVNLDLYENPQLTGVVCATGYVLAATTGLLRVASDMHNLSDVMAGAAVGTLVGLGVPWLFHYRFADIDDARSDEAPGPTVNIAPMGLGLTAFGTW